MCACRSSLISDICDVKQCMARPVPLTRKIYLFEVIFFWHTCRSSLTEAFQTDDAQLLELVLGHSSAAALENDGRSGGVVEEETDEQVEDIDEQGVQSAVGVAGQEAAAAASAAAVDDSMLVE